MKKKYLIDLASDPRCDYLYDTSTNIRNMMRQLVEKDYGDPYETDYAAFIRSTKYDRHAFNDEDHHRDYIINIVANKIQLVDSILTNGFCPTYDDHILTSCSVAHNKISLADGMHRYNICTILVERGAMTEIPARKPPRQWLHCRSCKAEQWLFCPKCGKPLTIEHEPHDQTLAR